jgi:tRNA/tmRNA/rRNA uracil-C5-methylase (TrmA/RlmC/RlmD family)
MIGIEIVADAIDDAWINADINNLKDKCYFVAGKAEKLIYNDIVINKKK